MNTIAKTFYPHLYYHIHLGQGLTFYSEHNIFKRPFLADLEKGHFEDQLPDNWKNILLERKKKKKKTHIKVLKSSTDLMPQI